jgi:hypothetical protein
VTRGTTVVVARTGDAIEAQIWVDMLRDEGIQAATYEQSIRGALGGASTLGIRGTHHILVRHEDIVAARNVIAESGGAHQLAPIPGDNDDAASKAARALVYALVGAAIFFALFVVFAVMLG